MDTPRARGFYRAGPPSSQRRSIAAQPWLTPARQAGGAPVPLRCRQRSVRRRRPPVRRTTSYISWPRSAARSLRAVSGEPGLNAFLREMAPRLNPGAYLEGFAGVRWGGPTQQIPRETPAQAGKTANEADAGGGNRSPQHADYDGPESWLCPGFAGVSCSSNGTVSRGLCQARGRPSPPSAVAAD